MSYRFDTAHLPKQQQEIIRKKDEEDRRRREEAQSKRQAEYSSPKDRKLKEYGEGYVPCEVSERWLQFPDNISDEKNIPVAVMTVGGNNQPKKLCEMVLSKEDITRALDNIQIKK